jgi:hypothetical protein
VTAVTHHETQIALEPDVPAVRITREFDAPPRRCSTPTSIRTWSSSGSGHMGSR